MPTLSERLGYQADPTAAIKEARQLLAAAGYAKGIKGVDFLVREVTRTRFGPSPSKPCSRMLL
jgi:peptide/nickel transport system substrate-binding protein